MFNPVILITTCDETLFHASTTIVNLKSGGNWSDVKVVPPTTLVVVAAKATAVLRVKFGKGTTSLYPAMMAVVMAIVKVTFTA